MTQKHYPIIIYELPSDEELGEELWHKGALTKLGLSILDSLREDGLNFLPESGIIEVPVREKVGEV